MGAKLARCHRVPQLSYRHPAREEVLGPYPLTRWYSPFPVDSDKILGALRVGGVSLDVVIPERYVQERSRLAAVSDGEVADRYRSFQDTPYADVSVVGVVDEHAGSGLQALEWFAPPAAASCAHIAIRPSVLPGPGLVIPEQHVVVGAVPLTWRSLWLLAAGLRLGDLWVLEPAAAQVLRAPSRK